MQQIKAIPTRYAGCLFRSRLEARYAVLFDHLGIRWDYEPQGYSTPDGPYLPDFYLRLGEPTWFEVKPEPPAKTRVVLDKRWFHLSAATNTRMIIAYGMPRPYVLEPYRSHLNDGHYEFLRSVALPDGEMFQSGDNYYAFCTCPWCGAVGIEFDGRGARVCGYAKHGLTIAEAEASVGHTDKAYSYNDPHIVLAYKAAHSARFEHGHSGAA